MKNIALAFVLALTVTGSVSFAHLGASATPSINVKTGMVQPNCPPSSGDLCGWPR